MCDEKHLVSVLSCSLYQWDPLCRKGTLLKVPPDLYTSVATMLQPLSVANGQRRGWQFVQCQSHSVVLMQT